MKKKSRFKEKNSKLKNKNKRNSSLKYKSNILNLLERIKYRRIKRLAR